MKQKRRLLLVLASLLILSGLFLVPSVRWPVYGWLRGEAFYQGMPTSWWAGEVQESFHELTAANWPTIWSADIRPSFSDRVRQWLLGYGRGDTWDTYSLLEGDSAALAILLELLRDESAKARRVAISGLCSLRLRKSEIITALELVTVNDPEDEIRREAMLALDLLRRESKW